MNYAGVIKQTYGYKSKSDKRNSSNQSDSILLQYLEMIYIFIALIFYTAAVLFSAGAARSANSNVVTAIINSFAALLPLALVAPILSKRIAVEQKSGLLLAILAGICIAVFTLALNKGFTVNKVGVIVPVVFGGAILLSTLLSYFIFKEKVTPLQLGGLMLLAIGLCIVIYARATGQ